MPNSPISEVIKAWHKEYNAGKSLFFAFLIFLNLVFGACILIQVKNFVDFLFSLYLFFFCAAIFYVYLSFTSKKLIIKEDQIVPDSLLAELADSEDVPKSMKAEIADKLQRNNCVTFGKLFELDCRFAQQEQAEMSKTKTGNGYQKMMAYRERDDK